MINHKALTRLRFWAKLHQFWVTNNKPGLAENALCKYVDFLMNNKLGIDTDNVDEFDQEPVKE